MLNSVWFGLFVERMVGGVTKRRLVLERSSVSVFFKVPDQCKTCAHPVESSKKVKFDQIAIIES